ncbi:hypothetical protein QTP70_031760, partial [Hemibagrus guttatus]
MERRKVDILCVQETRWKGSKARSIGAGFKLFYYGVDSKRNGVGVVLKEEFVRNVLEVKRVSDRVMSLKLEIEGVMLNAVSGYAPQVGCELEEKERFWSELDEVMESIPTGERVVIGADFNGHVGEGNTGDEEVMGKFGVKERNLEGQMVVDFAKRMDMGVVNTYFQKREEHRVTYKSGGRRTQVDYILCRRGNLKEISDCKVVVGESVARQHRMVVCRMTLMVCKTKRSKIEKKTKWWKLKKEECCEEFRQKLRQALGGQVVLPDDWETTAEVIRETGRKVLGVSSGRRKEDKETWWWNEEVQDSIQRKRLAKKKWDMDRTEENRQEYKELQRRVKREVSKAKQKAYEELYTRLDTREGEKDLYRLARQRDRDGKDVQQVRVIKDRDGRVLTSEESVQRRWKEYFEELMNEENEREKRVEGVNSVEQKVDKIRKDEVRKALKRMKSGKAVGPDDIPVEVWKCLGEAAVEFLANLFNRVLESERMPEEWRRSVLVPIFKNKGDVQSCSNYRGIKLMSHTMKVWERVVEARLRKVVEICEQQYGFMPRKSTTDAIFALRILMEKYRDGQKELHCVFVDLEKAYDRVPREELWYCMRKSGVAEKYVRVVQDMYERSRTVVRCAVGQTEEFNVEVGLHQGSALSPFLFAMVMDQLSEEVRQESPWTMMFADDIVICSESREQVEENLERWRFALERRGMKVSRSKTEYMCVNEREGSGTVRLQGEEVKKVQEFKYLGSTVQSNGECGKEVKKRVQAGWNGWRKVSGVLCDQKISARIKGKVYRTVVRAAMLYGLETVSLRKRQESELEVAELKMLRFSLGVTRLDRIRNEYIRGTAHVGRLGDKVREARLRWFGHVQRRDSYSWQDDATQQVISRELLALPKMPLRRLDKHFPAYGLRGSCFLQVGGEFLPQVEEFKYHGVMFMREGRMDRKLDRRIGAAAAVMRSMHRSVVVKKELSRKAKLSIYQSIYVPTLSYSRELWVMTERARSWIQAAEMSFLRKVAGRSLRDRVRSSATREELEVEPLLLHIESGQLRWLGHLFRMPPGRLPGEVFRACPTGKRPRGRPRTRWRDYVSRLTWERLGIPPEELEEVVQTNNDDNRKYLQALGFLPADVTSSKQGLHGKYKIKGMSNLLDLIMEPKARPAPPPSTSLLKPHPGFKHSYRPGLKPADRTELLDRTRLLSELQQYVQSEPKEAPAGPSQKELQRFQLQQSSPAKAGDSRRPPRPRIDKLLFRSGANRPRTQESLSSVDEKFIQGVVKQLGQQSVNMDTLTPNGLDQLSEVITQALQVVDDAEGLKGREVMVDGEGEVKRKPDARGQFEETSGQDLTAR